MGAVKDGEGKIIKAKIEKFPVCHTKDFGYVLVNEDKGVGGIRETTGSFKSGHAETYLHSRKYNGDNGKTQRQLR